jgi:outer membrane protein assembly factor BamB
VALDKKTGKLVWKSNLPGKNILDGQWSSPVGTTIGGRTQVVFPGGDGWLYSFDAPTGKLLWKFDCNPKKSVFKLGGKGDRNFFVATPVIHDGKLYIGVGDEPDNGGGVGHLWCVDVTKEPKNEAKDLSPVGDDFDPKAAANKDSGLVWHFGGKLSPKPEGAEREVAFCRTLSTVAVYDGLVYAADLEGYAYCLDASTGKKYWDFDLQTSTWCSPYYVEGRVLVGADSGELFLFPHGKEKKDPVKIDMDQALKTPPVAAGGVLYITNGTTLFAVAPVD